MRAGDFWDISTFVSFVGQTFFIFRAHAEGYNIRAICVTSSSVSPSSLTTDKPILALRFFADFLHATSADLNRRVQDNGKSYVYINNKETVWLTICCLDNFVLLMGHWHKYTTSQQRTTCVPACSGGGGSFSWSIVDYQDGSYSRNPLDDGRWRELRKRTCKSWRCSNFLSRIIVGPVYLDFVIVCSSCLTALSTFSETHCQAPIPKFQNKKFCIWRRISKERIW